MHGILNVDKPEGITSMDVVRRVKRASAQKRVGHGGTLDPIAMGVIPICIGQATRMMEYLIEGTKEYRGEVALGEATDTYDAVGEVTSRSDASQITLEEVRHALESFAGEIDQVPPMFSALKRQGKRLYDLARAGIEVDRSPRKVKVTSIRIVDWAPPSVTLEVKCGRGFYMRSLAHDLGNALGCGGHLKALTRTRSGPFELSDALSLDDVDRVFGDGSWNEFLHSPDVAVRSLRAVVVGERIENMLKNGRPVPPGTGIPFSKPYEKCRVYAEDGRFVAIVAFNPSPGQWEPERVLNLGDLAGS